MKQIIFTVVVALMMTVGMSLRAEEVVQLPFASEIRSYIRNYNRATPRLATSGTPSKGAYKELSRKGIHTFIDLRNQDIVIDKARLEVEGAGSKYYNIPVFGNEGISKDQVKKFAGIFENSEGLVLLHCGSGNRVGALWTAYQLSNNVPAEEAILQGKAAGMRSALLEDVKQKFCTSC